MRVFEVFPRNWFSLAKLFTILVKFQLQNCLEVWARHVAWHDWHSIFSNHSNIIANEFFPTKRYAQYYFRSKEKVRVFEVQNIKESYFGCVCVCVSNWLYFMAQNLIVYIRRSSCTIKTLKKLDILKAVFEKICRKINFPNYKTLLTWDL